MCEKAIRSLSVSLRTILALAVTHWVNVHGVTAPLQPTHVRVLWIPISMTSRADVNRDLRLDGNRRAPTVWDGGGVMVLSHRWILVRVPVRIVIDLLIAVRVWVVETSRRGRAVMLLVQPWGRECRRSRGHWTPRGHWSDRRGDHRIVR